MDDDREPQQFTLGPPTDTEMVVNMHSVTTVEVRKFRGGNKRPFDMVTLGGDKGAVKLFLVPGDAKRLAHAITDAACLDQIVNRRNHE